MSRIPVRSTSREEAAPAATLRAVQSVRQAVAGSIISRPSSSVVEKRRTTMRRSRFWLPLPLALLGLTTVGLSQAIPKTFWGVHTNKPDVFALRVPYGQWRAWDSGAQWQIMSKCPVSAAQCQNNPSLSTVDWSRLDAFLAGLKNDGVDDVFYTLNRTPVWATPHPDDSNCDYGNGECWPPLGLNLDGSGPDLIWKEWVRRIANHGKD